MLNDLYFIEPSGYVNYFLGLEAKSQVFSDNDCLEGLEMWGFMASKGFMHVP